MKNVERSFITELEERESDEIGLARTPVPLWIGDEIRPYRAIIGRQRNRIDTRAVLIPPVCNVENEQNILRLPYDLYQFEPILNRESAI